MGRRWFRSGPPSIGKTKSYGVFAEIERTSEEPAAVLRIGNLMRVREDALMGWISDHGVADGPTRPTADGPDDGVAPDAA